MIAQDIRSFFILIARFFLLPTVSNSQIELADLLPSSDSGMNSCTRTFRQDWQCVDNDNL